MYAKLCDRLNRLVGWRDNDKLLLITNFCSKASNSLRIFIMPKQNNVSKIHLYVFNSG